MSAADRWAEALAAWSIPDPIMAQAPESPWTLPPREFVKAAERALLGPHTPTHLRALEALPLGGTLLDVGAGAGAASLPLLRWAGRIVAVDQSQEMLDEFSRLAGDSVEIALVRGVWPDAATEVSPSDVTVCANVAYNVPQLDRFVGAFTEKTGRRVTMELTADHPQTPLNWLWKHFWDLDRPDRPTADDALAVVMETTGLEVGIQRWERTEDPARRLDPERIAWIRRRLCLDPSRDQELADLLASRDGPEPSPMATLWWPGKA